MMPSYYRFLPEKLPIRLVSSLHFFVQQDGFIYLKYESEEFSLLEPSDFKYRNMVNRTKINYNFISCRIEYILNPLYKTLKRGLSENIFEELSNEYAESIPIRFKSLEELID